MRINRINSKFANVPGPYAMSINVVGSKFHGNYAALVKPLFDGVISALHFDSNAESTPAVCTLLATALRESKVEVANALRNPTNTVFGSRIVVAPYRQFVKWNPADELCLTGKLNMTHCDSVDWLIEVAVFPLVAIPAPSPKQSTPRSPAICSSLKSWQSLPPPESSTITSTTSDWHLPPRFPME